ncbi:hypothetical protein V6N13_046630 [Hibiscus sabdariffa]
MMNNIGKDVVKYKFHCHRWSWCRCPHNWHRLSRAVSGYRYNHSWVTHPPLQVPTTDGLLNVTRGSTDVTISNNRVPAIGGSMSPSIKSEANSFVAPNAELQTMR